MSELDACALVKSVAMFCIAGFGGLTVVWIVICRWFPLTELVIDEHEEDVT